LDNLRGIGFMVLSMALFAVEDGFIKASSGHMPTGMILIVLGICGAGFYALLAKRRGHRLMTPLLLTTPILVRNLSELFGTMAFVTALSLIPLATAAAIMQATPLLMTLGAAILLREPVGWRRWTAIWIGLSGVLLILRPGMDSFDPNALFAVLGVVALATRDLGARYVPRDVSNIVLSCYGFASVIPAGVLLLLMSGDWPAWPGLMPAALLLGAVIFGVGGYYGVTIATRTGDVSVVTPFRYARLLFAMVLGALVFAELPDWPTLAGATIIIVTGVYTLLREARLRRTQHRANARG